MNKDEVIEGLCEVIDDFVENEGYVPARAENLYKKYYIEWKTLQIKEQYKNAERDALKNLQAIHGKEEGLKQYNEIMERENGKNISN